MKFVTELRFVELLNKELFKNSSGTGLKPFVLGRDGYQWASDGLQQEETYRRALNFVRNQYGITH